MAAHAIFINYRRDDSADVCGRIFDRLEREFGAESVFKDVDALPVGVEFGPHIIETLSKCRVVLAVIGPTWSDAKDIGGNLRLHNSDDWVRIELESARRLPGLQIVPVLVNGASLPPASEMPESIRFLPTLNAAFVRRDPDFHKDMDRLIAALKDGTLTGLSKSENANPSQTSTMVSVHWEQIRGSKDAAKLLRFADSFPGTSEAFEARERAAVFQQRDELLSRVFSANSYKLKMTETERAWDNEYSRTYENETLLKKAGAVGSVRARRRQDAELLRAWLREHGSEEEIELRLRELEEIEASEKSADAEFYGSRKKKWWW